MFFLPSLKKSGHLELVHMTLCIVGSRKIENQDDLASQDWDIFAPNLTIYGFDADSEACNQANADIENRQVNWTEKHIPLALSKVEKRATLYVTKFPGCSSLYSPNENYINRFIRYSESLKLSSLRDVDTTTLEKFFETETGKQIDFLQLDVQGAELDVLEGASKFLEDSVLGIVTEVEFSEMYVSQPLFGDLDVYLRNKGFTLFDLGRMRRDHRREVPIISKNHPGQLIWTDAFYFRDLLRFDFNTHLKTPEKLLKLACIADIMEFYDYALEILEYLTLNYGSEPQYNFAENIIESLALIPELVEEGLESLPIVARMRDLLSGDDIKWESLKAPATQDNKNSYHVKWQESFKFKGKSLYYNRIGFNNASERAIEIPIAFNFLATLRNKNKILEVGNTLSHYENALSECIGVRPRLIVDKFEIDLGIDNVDLMDISSEEKYDAIISVSTVEHIGQGVEPSGAYGEQIDVRDREAPLKAIAKIYELLNKGGKALITVPFGKLTDFGWYIQFNQEYLALLVNQYKVPEKGLSKTFLRRMGMELNNSNPRQIWVEVEESVLSDVEYNWPWPCANAIAIIELTKLEDKFCLNHELSPIALNYHTPTERQPTLGLELIEDGFMKVFAGLREINLIFYPDWSQSEEAIFSDILMIVRSLWFHPDRYYMTLLIDHSNISEEDANLILSSVTMSILMQEDLDVSEESEIYLISNLTNTQCAALSPRIQSQVILKDEKSRDTNKGKMTNIQLCLINSFINQRAVQLETGAWELK
jgi:FkbM family methyltransferase